MFLKKILKNRLVTISYYQDGCLQTYKGRICSLDLSQQTLSIKNEFEQICSIRLAGIKDIQ